MASVVAVPVPSSAGCDLRLQPVVVRDKGARHQAQGEERRRRQRQKPCRCAATSAPAPRSDPARTQTRDGSTILRRIPQRRAERRRASLCKCLQVEAAELTCVNPGNVGGKVSGEGEGEGRADLTQHTAGKDG